AICTGIDDYLAIDAENAALPIGVSRDPVMMVAGMGAGQEMFVALLDPPHRVTELQRQRSEHDFLGVQPRLGPEAAADIGSDDPDAALFDAKNFAQRDPHRVRSLGGGIDHNLVQTVVAISEHPAAFHRSA